MAKKIEWKRIWESGEVKTLGARSKTLAELCERLSKRFKCKITVDAFLSSRRRWCNDGGRPSDVLCKDKPEANEVEKAISTRQERLTLAGLRKRVNVLTDELVRERTKTDLIFGLAEESPKKSKPIKARKQKRYQATAVALASDWHIEENVEPGMVNGLNKYTPAIAQARSEKFFRDLVWKIKHHRSNIDIDNVVLWIGGDIISGYIHEELVESNHMSPTEAILFAFELFTSGIDFLLKELDINIQVPCSYGNHGRTTIKRRISTGAKNSYEWALYKFLEKHYAGNEQVQFQVATGDYTYMDVYEYTIRFGHGDNFGGGGQNLWSNIAKVAAKLDTMTKADYTACGHFHTLGCANGVITNGSLIGTGPYGLKIGARHEPAQQAFFLMKPGRGLCDFSAIWLEER